MQTSKIILTLKLFLYYNYKISRMIDVTTKTKLIFMTIILYFFLYFKNIADQAITLEQLSVTRTTLNLRYAMKIVVMDTSNNITVFCQSSHYRPSDNYRSLDYGYMLFIALYVPIQMHLANFKQTKVILQISLFVYLYSYQQY